MDTNLLDLSPDDEQTLLRLGERAVAEGRFVDARAYFIAGVDTLLARGDMSGAEAFRARLDRLALADLEQHLDAARNRAGAGVSHGPAPAHRVPTAPPQPPSHGRWPASSQQGRDSNGDFQLRASLARVFVARGDAIGAAEYLTPEMADGDPLALLAIAEIQLRGGKFDHAVTLIERIVAEHPSLIAVASQLGAEVAPYAPDVSIRLAGIANGAAARHLSAEHADAQRGVEPTVILAFRPQSAGKAKKHA